MSQKEEKALAPAEETAPEEQLSDEEKKKKRRSRAAKAGVALFTSASVLVGGLFPSPDALLAEEQDLNPVAVVQNENDTGDDLDGDGGDGEGSAEEEEEESSTEATGLRAGLRQKILQLPLAVRVFVLIPMWALGWAVWTVASGLWTMLLGPIAGKAVSWLFLLAALLGAFVLGVKAIFPDLPIRKIVNKKSLLGLLIGGLTLGAADLTVPLFWDGYEKLAQIFRASGVALILGTVSFALVRRVLRRRREEAEAAEKNREPEEEKEPEPRPWTDAEILALADSVGRKH